MPGKELQQVAHLQIGAGAGAGAQAAVFLGEGMALQVVAPFYLGKAVFGGDAFETGIGDHLFGGGPTGDHGEHAQGVLEAQAESGVGRVHQRVGAGLNLGDAVVGGGHVVVAGAR